MKLSRDFIFFKKVHVKATLKKFVRLGTREVRWKYVLRASYVHGECRVPGQPLRCGPSSEKSLLVGRSPQIDSRKPGGWAQGGVSGLSRVDSETLSVEVGTGRTGHSTISCR